MMRPSPSEQKPKKVLDARCPFSIWDKLGYIDNPENNKVGRLLREQGLFLRLKFALP